MTGGAFYLQVKGHIMQSSEEPVLRQPRNHLCAGARSPNGDGGDGCSEWGEEQARGGQGGLRGRDGPGLGWGEAGTARRGDGGQGRNGPPSDGSDQR